ncbi:MAG TPA: histone deacetylase [Longimicrobiales bacterium]|nr:histone deacetylase [Longimicrobiales bacterium]
MKTFYCDHFVLPLPDGHRFPMRKYALLRERVAGDPRVELIVPDGATDQELLRVHAPEYLQAVVSGTLSREDQRRIGFPWSPGLVERSRRSVGGTLAAARAALEEGFAANLAGGTHHAFAHRGEGFCVFNDVAVAARDAQARGRVRRVAVVDLDVHQGNGTAAIFREDDSVLTLSVHGEGNFPFRKEESDLDISLPDGTTDEAYLEAVDHALRIALRWEPELILYLAGADPYEGDALGRLSVSMEGMARRDALVYDHAERSGVPLALVMSGGYAPEVEEIARIHAGSVLAAAERWEARRGLPSRAPT